MLNNFFNNLKFNRLSYLLEVIELRDFKSKIKAYNKIRRINLSEDMGHLILDKIDFIHDENYSDINITISLISLIFKNYYPSYSDKLLKLYPKLSLENKKELLNILSVTDDDNVIILYRDLVSKYYKELDNIPIGNLSINKGNYVLLFPELYKSLKLEINKNNVVVLLNDFVNAGVVPVDHLKKNKKIIQNNIINIFKEGLKYKYKNEFFMSDKEYINLRIFLEAAISLELYVSNKDTKLYLEKYLKKKDNQLKLFVLDNYIRKEKSISRVGFTSIAKDPFSRYPLYSFLVFNKLEKLMPKKYLNLVSLAESDLAINFSIFNSYSLNPYDFEFIEERIVNNYKYLVFKFKTKYNYNEEIVDPATDYLLKNLNIDEKLIKDGETTYIGISGGYNVDGKPYLIEKPLNELKVSKYEDKNYEKIVNSLLSNIKAEPKKEEIISKKDKKKKISEEKLKAKEDIKAAEEEVKKIQEELDKAEAELQKQELKEVSKEVEEIKKALDDAESDLKEKQKQLDSNIEIKSNYFDNEEEKVSKHPILRAIFSFNSLLILISFTIFFFIGVLVMYVNNIDLFNIMKDRKQFKYGDNYKEYTLKTKDRFNEIPYTEMFNQPDVDYYVLFFNKKDKSVYYPFIDKFLRSDYKIYYVSKGKDNISFEHDGTSFNITTDTFFRITDGDYNFFIVEKSNILKEFKIYIDEIEAKEKEETEKKAKEEAEKEKQAKKEAIEKSRIHEMVAAPSDKNHS